MDTKNITVKMTMEQYEELKIGYEGRNNYIKMFKEAHDEMRKNGGSPILTDKLKNCIEEIYE